MVQHFIQVVCETDQDWDSIEECGVPFLIEMVDKLEYLKSEGVTATVNLIRTNKNNTETLLSWTTDTETIV